MADIIKFEDGIFPISVDYKSSLEELIILGNYEDVHSEDADRIISSLSNDCAQKAYEAEIRLAFCLEKLTFLSDFIKNLKQNGYYPLGIRELLIFGIDYPDIQLNFPILEVADTGYWEEKLSGNAYCKEVVCKHEEYAYLFRNPYDNKMRSLYTQGKGNVLLGREQRIIVSRVK